jgi:hypothetical protein
MEESRLIHLEESLKLLLDKLADHISQCNEHWKRELLISERMIRAELTLEQIEWKEIGLLHGRVQSLEKLKDSGWQIFQPILSTLIGGGIGWAIAQLMSK